jgi:hypothetical protein
LTQVVAERIDHEVREVAVGLSEDHISVLGVALLQLLLKVAASVLVLAQRKKLSLEVFDSDAGESVVCGSALQSPLITLIRTHILDLSRLACSSDPLGHQGTEHPSRIHRPQNRTDRREHLSVRKVHPVHFETWVQVRC